MGSGMGGERRETCGMARYGAGAVVAGNLICGSEQSGSGRSRMKAPKRKVRKSTMRLLGADLLILTGGEVASDLMALTTDKEVLVPKGVLASKECWHRSGQRPHDGSRDPWQSVRGGTPPTSFRS